MGIWMLLYVLMAFVSLCAIYAVQFDEDTQQKLEKRVVIQIWAHAILWPVALPIALLNVAAEGIGIFIRRNT